MKKRIAIIVSVLMILCLFVSGCGSSGSDPTPQTVQYGGQTMSPEEEILSDQRIAEYNEIVGKLDPYLGSHKDGKLYEHYSGIWFPSSLEEVTIRLDDIHNAEVLAELEAVGIQSHYRLEEWPASRTVVMEAAYQLRTALAELKEKENKNKEEKLLLTKYKPEIMTYAPPVGTINITLHCDTIWYEHVSEAAMYKDRETAISLFKKYIGDYEFLSFIFPA